MSRLGLLISLVSFSAFAQEPNYVFEDTINDKNLVKLSSYNSYSSNRFNNEFMDKFLFGGTIDQELKDKNANRLGRMNTIGGEFEQRVDSYTPDINLFKKEHLGLKLSFSDNHYISSNLPSDLFQLAMNGNESYQGDSLDFTFAHAQYLHYQKLSVGFFDERNLSSIQISYVTGSKAAEFGLYSSHFYTSPNADSIAASLSGSGLLTDRFSPYWAFQGGGFSIDIDYNFIFEGKMKDRQIINFKINNLGMIIWNRSTKNYVIQSNTSFNGFDIQDILNGDSTATQIDVLDTLGISETTGRYIDFLPVEFVVQKLPDNALERKWQAIYGFKTIMSPDYFPYLYAGAYYRPTPEFSVSSRLSYGGFAGVRMGVNFNYWLKEKLYFGAGTFDLIGLLSKKIGFGRGFNFAMYYKL